MKKRNGAMALAALLACAPLAAGPAPEPTTWVLVDTANETLLVLQDDQVIETFPDIALGRRGAAANRHAGDLTTPKGVFYISWINRNSRYHLFFGLDYPSPSHAEEAYREQVIDAATFRRISLARSEHRLPPQDTALGGDIGIHGTGALDPELHRLFDWTDGCVALTNEQIDELAHWVGLGTMVVIR